MEAQETEEYPGKNSCNGQGRVQGLRIKASVRVYRVKKGDGGHSGNENQKAKANRISYDQGY